ncbi:PREDICTED: protein AKNAD1 [Miniopterus natalensis]|uniref:protein AKNAD1 n=1 Tax=Miniopterus natalensis TaxID=291302 RepID=UPI0007A6D6CC|nr:PREDICTED: protein AKNAD1 [Miniopterus natalensis]
MDGADFSEATALKQQEDFPYEAGFSQTELYDDYNFSSENDILNVSGQMISMVEDPQEKATREETCRNADRALTLDKMTENAVQKKYDHKEQRCPPNLHIPASKGNFSKSNLSDILQPHLSKEDFLKGRGIHCETLPETPRTDCLDEAIVKDIIVHYVERSWLKEPTSELTDTLSPQKDDEGVSEPSCSPTATGRNASELEKPAAAKDSSHPKSSSFLTKTKSPSDKWKGCQVQKLQTEKTGPGHRFKYDQVHYRFSDLSNVAPKVKIPKMNMTVQPLPIDKQVSFSPELRARLALVQDISGSMSRWNCVEEGEQKKKTMDPSQQVEIEPETNTRQEHLTGTESEASLFKLSSTPQKDPSLSSSYIFQKISQGENMCQKLKEQTIRLKTKVQEFSESLAQDTPCYEQDERLVLEKLQAHLELLEQEFVANKEKHLTLEQQVHKHESPAVNDFDPEREVEGGIFQLEMLPEGVEGKMDEGKHSSAGSPPVSPPAVPGDLPSASSPPSDEEANCGDERPPEDQLWKAPHCPSRTGTAPRFTSQNSHFFCVTWVFSGPDTGLSCSSAAGIGLQSKICETCGTKVPNSPRGCHKEPLKEFHYRYNTPGQTYLNHSEGITFVQLFLNENNSSPCKYISRANSKSSQDEHEPIPGKKNLKAPMTSHSDLAASSAHFHSCRISGSKSLSNISSVEETKSEGLNSSLDHALRTAIVLKETTDQMIRTIAEDLAKLQRRRNQLKY